SRSTQRSGMSSGASPVFGCPLRTKLKVDMDALLQLEVDHGEVPRLGSRRAGISVGNRACRRRDPELTDAARLAGRLCRHDVDLPDLRVVALPGPIEGAEAPLFEGAILEMETTLQHGGDAVLGGAHELCLHPFRIHGP